MVKMLVVFQDEENKNLYNNIQPPNSETEILQFTIAELENMKEKVECDMVYYAMNGYQIMNPNVSYEKAMENVRCLAWGDGVW